MLERVWKALQAMALSQEVHAAKDDEEIADDEDEHLEELRASSDRGRKRRGSRDGNGQSDDDEEEEGESDEPIAAMPVAQSPIQFKHAQAGGQAMPDFERTDELQAVTDDARVDATAPPKHRPTAQDTAPELNQ